MEKVRLGVIGLGHRGLQISEAILYGIPEIEIVAVADTIPERIKVAQEKIKEKRNIEAFGTLDYHEILNSPDVDAVFVATGWESHVSVSIEALKAGKATAMEVGGAYNTEELWELVDTVEKTKVPFMFMENCCFGEYELMVTNMVRQGKFGKISHCSGAYSHDLREELSTYEHYRLQNYIDRNCENYPTHELGPIAKLLGINRGNRMTKLVSISSVAQGLHEYMVEHKDKILDEKLINKKISQGDIVNTLITCENGETISLKLDTTLPRFYSREFSVHGTKGLYSELAHTLFLDGENHWNTREIHKSDEKYLDEYSTNMWKKFTPEDRESSHGGMDLFEFRSFAYHLLNNLDMPIDVYDAAAWMAITCLSEKSIKEGTFVDIPDFTRGKYKDRPIKDVVDFSKD